MFQYSYPEWWRDRPYEARQPTSILEKVLISAETILEDKGRKTFIVKEPLLILEEVFRLGSFLKLCCFWMENS